MPTPRRNKLMNGSPRTGLSAGAFPLTDVDHDAHLKSRDTTDPASLVQWAWIDVHRIVPFGNGPRLLRNPKWDQIKATIMASGGLTAPLSVTRRPNEDVYVCHQGGNTRLLILQELFRETKDQRFAKTYVHIVPFEDDFDLAVLHDRENTCRGSLRYIEEAWSKYRLYEIYAARAGTKPTIRQFIADMARDHGIALSVEAFSRMRFTVEVLYQHIPTCLVHGGMSLKSVRRLVSIRSALKKAWRRRELGPDPIFDEAFYGLLARQDKALAETFLDNRHQATVSANPRIVIDWTRLLQDMRHEFAVSGDVDYQTAAGWIASACRALPVCAEPETVPVRRIQSQARPDASTPIDKSLDSLRLAAFAKASELVELAELGQLVEPKQDSFGYEIKAIPAPATTPMAKACWWALVLSSKSAEDVSEFVRSHREAPSFVHMSPAALTALSKLLAIQARIAEQEI